MRDTELVALRGDDNFWDVDVTGDLDAGDQVWFRAARSELDLNDTDAVIKKGRGVVGLTGIADIDTPTGKFQIQLEPADTVNLLDEALVYHCILRKADVAMDTTILKGVMRLTG